MLSAIVSTILHLTAGALSDRLGRKPVYFAGVVAMGVLIFPAFALFNTGTFALMLIAHVLIFDIALSLATIYREARKRVLEGSSTNNPDSIEQARGFIGEIAEAWTQIGSQVDGPIATRRLAPSI